MIRTNLATTPSRGGTGVRGWVAAAALGAAIFTIVNLAAIVYFSRSDSSLKAQAAADEARAARLHASAARLTRSLAGEASEPTGAGTSEARALIARRVFSWTELLNQFEATLPAGARITSIRPGTRTDDHVVLEITLFARGVDDLDRFLTNLEASGRFAGVLSRDERRTEGGELEAVIEATYLPREFADTRTEAATP